MPAIHPIPDEYYRIQNVEYATFIELSVPNENAEVTMRLQKPIVEKQQWVFIRGHSRDTYKIKSVVSISNSTDLFLSVEGDNACVVEDEEDAIEWSVRFDASGNNCTLDFRSKVRDHAPSARPKAKHHFALATKNCDLVISPYNRAGEFNINNTGNDDYKWTLIPVWPSLPKDVYRIRSLTGHAIFLTDNHTFAVDLQHSRSHQTWELEPKHNAKCDLRNVDTGLYLNSAPCKERDTFEVLRAGDQPAVWQLQRIGDFAYSISVNVPHINTPLALTLLQDHEQLILKPLKNARNQIWFLEPADVEADNADISVPAPPPYEGRRYPEIKPGTYSFVNCAYTSRCLHSYSDPWRFFPRDSTRNCGGDIGYERIRISYVSPASPAFYLTMPADEHVHATPSQENTLAAGTTPRQWVLERENDGKSGYRYFIRSFDTQLVISGETTQDLNRYDVFRLDTKVSGNPVQMWKLLPVGV